MRLLILSVSVGAGHVRAAEALFEEASSRGESVRVEHWDVLDFTAPLYRKVYADGYLRVVNRSPALWGYLYAKADEKTGGEEASGLVKAFDRVHFRKFRDAVRDFAPDRIVATHFLPCQVFRPGQEAGRFDVPISLVLTDFDAHRFWVQPTADQYFVACEELAAVLAGRGISPERIQVTGIPIDRRFREAGDRGAARSRLGLEGDAPVVLIMGGGFGTGGLVDTARAVLEVEGARAIAVAGRNPELEAALRELAIGVEHRLKVRGFVNDVPDLMSASDLIVTKSGGATTSECLATGLPMLVRDPTPGQEERNCDYVMEAGAAWKAHGAGSLRYKLKRLLADPGKLSEMSAAARRVGRPEAAAAILDSLI
ncbi:MAG: glycosyltransferase [Planctomycetota bacterium]